MLFTKITKPKIANLILIQQILKNYYEKYDECAVSSSFIAKSAKIFEKKRQKNFKRS